MLAQLREVNIIPLWNDSDIASFYCQALLMARTRMDELYALAEERDGLLTSKEARALGIQDSVLVRLAQRGRLERMSRGVYRIVQYPIDSLAQYREAILWAQAGHHGPERIALSHETALSLYGISDVNPALVHLTVPRSARLRRVRPKWIMIHRADLDEEAISQQDGLPLTTVERSIMEVLSTTRRVEIARQAVTDALRAGLLKNAQAAVLRKFIGRSAAESSSSKNEIKVKPHESTTT